MWLQQRIPNYGPQLDFWKISQTKKTAAMRGILVLEDKLSSHLKFTYVIYTKLQTKCSKSDMNQN